jgi:hypothetical protein
MSSEFGEKAIRVVIFDAGSSHSSGPPATLHPTPKPLIRRLYTSDAAFVTHICGGTRGTGQVADAHLRV